MVFFGAPSRNDKEARPNTEAKIIGGYEARAIRTKKHR
jgi:hypothetical protein